MYVLLFVCGKSKSKQFSLLFYVLFSYGTILINRNGYMWKFTSKSILLISFVMCIVFGNMTP